MAKSKVLGETVPPYSVRKALIEAEPLPANIGALLDQAAEEAGDHPAIDFFEAGRALTYRQLKDSVDRCANGMRAIGIGRGSHVAVMLPNIIEFPITWLAIARLGAVMVPVNTAYTPRELDHVVTTGEATSIVIDESCLATFAAAAAAGERIAADQMVVVGAAGAAKAGARDWSSLLEGKSGAFHGSEAVGHGDLLNIQFTSGTTGFPKGVMLTQEYWLVSGKQNAFRDGRRYGRILASTPFFYMDPQWQLLMALYQRGTLYVANRQSGSRYMEWARTLRIEFGLLPEIVVKQPPSPRDRDNDIVRVNVYGIARDLHTAIEERFDLVAREAFGMTEIGTGLFMPIEETAMVGSGSCGVPAPFREARIVDSEGRPVADGETGELQIRGRGILKGYYGNPDATRAAFDGDWFRTGDIFRRDASGFYSIVGRVKDMIRRSGENIAAREVEAVILASPDVAEAAAVPVKDAMRGEEVKAVIVLQQGVVADEPTLRRIVAQCLANLAPFKVPRYFQFRADLPKTASGKIAKPQILAEAADPRAGCFDRATDAWI
ncbi:MAG: AMP-binding protein [Hyphomicrobiaceae bacterium]